MSNIILTQIPAQATFKFVSSSPERILILRYMSTVKFINEIIYICFSAGTFQFIVYQCHKCTGVQIFGEAKNFCPNLTLLSQITYKE